VIVEVEPGIALSNDRDGSALTGKEGFVEGHELGTMKPAAR
jgi:hypothetical protein